MSKSLETQLAIALRQNEELRELLREASVDFLTGLPMRRQFEHRVKEELSQHHHHPEHHFSIFVIDLNDLKKVNDTHGHSEGDRMIIEFGELFKKLMREYDMVARIGGDEFTAILPGESKEGAELVKQRLLQKFDEFRDSMVYFSGASIGVASTSEGLLSYETLFEQADQNMYTHKKATRELLLVKKTA
ncbi:MAG: GGDEF domain-containing protein [Patescibacteria group bacterium]